MSCNTIELKKERAQTLPTVLIMCAVLAIMATGMLFLFRQQNKNIVIFADTMRKQELGTIGLEHALYKLQEGNNWYRLPLPGLQYDKEYSTPNGNYTLTVERGNLFMNSSSVRQAPDDFRTIGIKVKVSNTAKTAMYYAVVKKGAYAGALISKGVINLPCTDTIITDAYYNFFWGDVYSANPKDGACRIPVIAVGRGNVKPQYWLPEVYAKGNIYTALSVDANIFSTDYTFGYTYEDMYPTAKCHPYSAYAKAPEVDLDFYRYQAWKNNAYYGPATIDGNTNPYYCGKSLTQVVLALTSKKHLESIFLTNLQVKEDVLFIDTTDGHNVAVSSGVANTYSGVTYAAAASSLKLYYDDTNQYRTRGTMVIMGPLYMCGSNPDKMPAPYSAANGSSDITDVKPPNNYYYPQGDGPHYDVSSSLLSEVKHAGFLYMGGELVIGHPTTNLLSSVVIYGSIYLDEYGSLRGSTSPDFAFLYVYFNTTGNMFGYMGSGVAVMSFNELTWLIPTPAPNYPASF